MSNTAGGAIDSLPHCRCSKEVRAVVLADSLSQRRSEIELLAAL